MPFVLPFKGRVPSYKYAATDGKGLTELRGACASNCLGKRPVLNAAQLDTANDVGVFAQPAR